MAEVYDGARNGNSAASRLRARLDEPATAEALNQLLDHADLLAFSVTSLDGFVRRGEVIADNVAASVADLKRSLPPTNLPDGAQLTQLLKQLPKLAALGAQLGEITSSAEFQQTLVILGKPETLSALNRLLGQTELLSFAITALEAFLARGDQLTDNIRAGLRDVTGSLPADLNLSALADTLGRLLPYLPKLAALAPKLVELVERLEPFVASSDFDALLNSDLLNPTTVGLLGRAGNAFAASYEASQRSDHRIGLLGLLRAMNDPDVQRALGLFTDFGKRFGQSLDQPGR